MLANIGIKNAINTSCPTTWKLSPDHCAKVPTTKSDDVVTTITDYYASPTDDPAMLNLLLDSYKRVFIWLQGLNDYPLLKRYDVLQNDKVVVIPPNLRHYENILDSENLDYIGTRLHGGIKALQRFKRTLILAVDNRALEIARDIKLNAVLRSDITAIKRFIFDEYKTELNIPLKAIHEWKSQFA
jgi:hypothetical protein